MRILLTNDDGINAEGITRLALSLAKSGHELFICAPAENKSCVSHGLTLRDLIFVEKRVLEDLPEVPAYAVCGTPADCVRIAVGKLGARPDVVVSGINQASNLGSDAVYSGTVAAALEGYMIDIPSVAFSKDTFETDHMEDAAKASAALLPELMRFFEGRCGMLNVNIPSVPISEYRGVRTARCALLRYDLNYKQEEQPDGSLAFSVDSVKVDSPDMGYVTDEQLLHEGYVVITPLTYDMTESLSFGLAKELFEKDGSI